MVPAALPADDDAVGDDAELRRYGFSVSGTCMSYSIAMGVTITQQGPDVVLEFGAAPR